ITDQAVSQNSIIFEFSQLGGSHTDEEYFLRVHPDNIQIIGSERGMFYGIQSLAQLLPLNFDGNALIPAVEIIDAPRFPYRGMHLDVSRHFMSVEFVKKFINLLSHYKYNHFHWHLTDDQGWRIEIKKYPKLTEIGSKRRESMVGKNNRPYVGDGIQVGGFYTQEQIREVVDFARSRFITIIPEIEMPAHSAAALAAYPELGCKAGFKYQVQTTWAASTNILCPTEQTFKFIADVLDDVVELFPDSPYLHVGGDEVKSDHWSDSQYVAALKKSKGLRTDLDVKNWFMQQVGSIVSSKGKIMVGWDETLDGELPSDAIVMAWRGESNGIAAAKVNRRVIMSPSEFTYFDHPQGKAEFEPLSIGPTITLQRVYDYEPVPRKISTEESRFVIGAQGCVWTEFIKTPSEAEYMVFPRALALAEVLWSKKTNRDYKDFYRRLENELPRLDRGNVNFRIPEPYGFRDQNVALTEDAIVDLRSPIPNGEIYYTLDGTNPHAGSSIYRERLVLNLAPNQRIDVKIKIIVSEQRQSPVFVARYTRSPGQSLGPH
ncbi:MAG TPA: family 20 glycosylhydrolase, partial [Pyrinomonadaceae bacterium]|nr:family 20 glycosylhydrolase [Pyrinomonadaceae bacterium]